MSFNDDLLRERLKRSYEIAAELVAVGPGYYDLADVIARNAPRSCRTAASWRDHLESSQFDLKRIEAEQTLVEERAFANASANDRSLTVYRRLRAYMAQSEAPVLLAHTAIVLGCSESTVRSAMLRLVKSGEACLVRMYQGRPFAGKRKLGYVNACQLKRDVRVG